MELVIGFLIAVSIGLTGVGGGVITAPVLILFLGMPAAEAVGTSLIFVAAVKTLAVPVYLSRKQVDFRVLWYLLLGGVPGVIAGSTLLARLQTGRSGAIVVTVVGGIVIFSAALTIWRYFREKSGQPTKENSPKKLSVAAGLIGAEVGFSSAGAGALGTLALFHFSKLTTAEIVGTDLMFGFVLALIGGGWHFAHGSFVAPVVIKLIAGGAVGALAGAYLGGFIPRQKLRFAMSVWLVWLGWQLCSRGWGALWT
ncbi:MAG TPA: sulfite exporter TauE/SafE family protein [Terriglobales bacterium]|nr:sulfite exporter TauE/SafE family protein [Terriglobales bacterium]